MDKTLANERKGGLDNMNWRFSTCGPHIMPHIHFGMPKFGEQLSFRQIHQILLPLIFSAIQDHIACLY